MNVAQWLNAIDLGQYEALFREHEIDGGVVPDLVEGDLEKIGVPLGHRKRLMRAIAALSAGETRPSAVKPTSTPSPSLQPTPGIDAERRPITVMFCDLVGSTSLAAKLDAEDWRTLVSAYLDEASAAVAGLGGHVLKKLGALVTITRVTMEPGSISARHSHPGREQIWIVEQGRAVLLMDQNQSDEVQAGDVVRTPGGSVHGVNNTGHEPFVYLAVTAPPQDFTAAYGERRNPT